jgi:antitoxin CptB
MSSTEEQSPDEIRLKRLRFQSWHRGFREMDLILGDFADAKLAGLSADDLDAYEALLSVPDWDLFAWLTETKPVPENWDNPAFRQVLDHVRHRPRI